MFDKILAPIFALTILSACETAPTAVAPVTFTQMSAPNVELAEALPDRGGFGFTKLKRKAEKRGVHRMVRVAPEGVMDEQRDLVRQCTLTNGGTVIAAERTDFANGDVGLLVTCSQ